jgi:hypothetical protein
MLPTSLLKVGNIQQHDSNGASDTFTVTIYVGSTAPSDEEEDPNFPDGNPDFDDIFGSDFNFDDIWE